MNYALQNRWVRSEDGYLGGVCEGLARALGLEAWLVRLLWIATIWFFGTGILMYGILWACLPREDRVDEAQRRKILGVCYRMSLRTGVELGVVRALTVILALCSLGAVVLLYIILNFVLPEEEEQARTTLIV